MRVISFLKDSPNFISDILSNVSVNNKILKFLMENYLNQKHHNF